MNNQRRPQKTKASPEHIRRVQELRRSNAAQPIPSKNHEDKRYSKYGIQILIEEDDDDDNPFMWE